MTEAPWCWIFACLWLPFNSANTNRSVMIPLVNKSVAKQHINCFPAVDLLISVFLIYTDEVGSLYSLSLILIWPLFIISISNAIFITASIFVSCCVISNGIYRPESTLIYRTIFQHSDINASPPIKSLDQKRCIMFLQASCHSLEFKWNEWYFF